MADIKEIVEKVNGAKNVLVALSKNPSVDEVSAAMGLTLVLDKLGKKATAIYSGETPDVLQFLNPEKTFSSDTNALQDFIIALDKDKADHLRYKVDGDYVKVFITPYHEAISENDLEYSYGDFNVDLIIALDVAEENDLDGALVEYGRIMHDAGVVNITTSSSGSFGETEWSNPEASSVSEMIAELATELSGEALEKNSATALLTGIVASTERFANEKTTPETMGVAAKLMGAGAEQRLIVENFERAENGKEQVPLSDTFSENEVLQEGEKPVEEETSVVEEEKPAEEEKEEPVVEEEKPAEEEAPAVEEEKPVEEEKAEEPVASEEPQKPVLETPAELLEETPAEEPAESFSKEISSSEDALLTRSTDSTSRSDAPSSSNSLSENDSAEKTEIAPAEEPKIELSGSGKPAEEKPEDTTHKTVKLQPSAEAQAELEQIMHEEPKKNEALDELNKYTGEQAATGGLKPDVGLSSIDTDNIGKTETKDYGEMMAAALDGDGGMPNPAVQAAPVVAAGPEVNHIPEMDYSQASTAEAEQPPVMQNGMLEPTETPPAGAAQEGMTVTNADSSSVVPGAVPAQEGMTEDILPPPPAPPVDGGIMPPGTTPAMPEMPAAPEPAVAPIAPTVPTPAPVTPVVPVAPTAPVAPTPAVAPEQVGPAPIADDPTAFRIPGM